MDAEGWDERYRERPLVWSAGPNQFVAEDLAGLEPGTALDVACGEGRNAVWLAELGWKTTGVDFSGVALDKAADMARDRGVEVEWVQADVTEWSPDRRFDLVLIAYVHLPEELWTGLVSRAATWVAPGGHLYLVGHDVVSAGVSGPPDPDLLWDPQTAASAAGDLTVLRAEQRVRLLDEGREAVDTVVIARNDK
jgi:SAM-dependent methyltransferase